jgi:hypothetical protein
MARFNNIFSRFICTILFKKAKMGGGGFLSRCDSWVLATCASSALLPVEAESQESVVVFELANDK